MSATNFKTENNTYRKLISNGLSYRIPHFQPDYSWTENEWEDLWADILGVIQANDEAAHYMGYPVLQSNDNKTFDVIEGQQRLTTLMLIILAVLKNLTRLIAENNNPENNQQRMDQIRQTYITYLDPVTLAPRTKLTLNRNNDGYFQNHLISLKHLPQTGCNESELRLCKAFEWFAMKMSEYTKNAGGYICTAAAALEAMQFIYPSDCEFRSAFSAKKNSTTASRCASWKNRYQEMITILKVLALTQSMPCH